MLTTTDAGHGGKDSGCAIKINGKWIKESAIALKIEREVSLYLNNKSGGLIKNTRTRTSDSTTALTLRSDIANKFCTEKDNYGNVLGSFASIHVNDASNLKANGVEVLYNPNRKGSKELAQKVLDRILETKLFRTNRKLKARTNLSVLNRTRMACCLVELGFIKDAKDRVTITSEKNQRILGQAIAKGVMDYHNIKVTENTTKEEKKEVFKVVRKAINIDGKDIGFDTILHKGKTYVGLRELLEFLGFEVLYNEDTKKIKANLSNVKIKYRGTVFTTNRLKINNKNFVEIRTLLERMDFKVFWNEKEKMIELI